MGSYSSVASLPCVYCQMRCRDGELTGAKTYSISKDDFLASRVFCCAESSSRQSPFIFHVSSLIPTHSGAAEPALSCVEW